MDANNADKKQTQIACQVDSLIVVIEELHKSISELEEHLEKVLRIEPEKIEKTSPELNLVPLAATLKSQVEFIEGEKKRIENISKRLEL